MSKATTRMLGSSYSLESLQVLIERFFGGTKVSLHYSAENNVWSVHNGAGPIEGCRVVSKGKRYRFEMEAS